MQDPKYAGKYGVEQQLRLLSKWLTENGFSEAAMLVSAAAISVYEAMHKRSVPRLRNRGPLTAARPLANSDAEETEPLIEEKRRVHSA